MKDRFYIGSLELCYSKGIFATLQQYDGKFREKVLPVNQKVIIDIVEIEELPIPEYEGKNFGIGTVWQNNDCEIRLYSEYEEEPYLMSVKRNNQITIWAKKSGWLKHRYQFRPWFNIHLEQLLLQNNALILHSASIIVKGKAIIFTAPSGTGKTTQTNLWHKYMDKVEDLNGDRTLLQKMGQKWFACGFPLYGGVLRCEQKAVPIAGIVIIRQGKEDKVKELSIIKKVSLLYSEITVPAIESFAVNRVMDLVEDLVKNITVIQLDCTMKKDAVTVLKQRLFKEGEV